VPEGSVQVIRGTRSSIDRDGLRIPVGLEGETGRLAAGYQNLGLPPESIPGAIEGQQRASTDLLQAQGYNRQADAALINANKPEFSEIQLAVPGRSDVNKLVVMKKNADGTITLEDTNTLVPADITKTTRLGQQKEKDTISGKETSIPVLLDAESNVFGDLPPDNRQRPPEIPPEAIPDYDAAYDTAIQAGEDPQQAVQTALAIVARKRARQEQQEE
jgi:hypothetical protein